MKGSLNDSVSHWLLLLSAGPQAPALQGSSGAVGVTHSFCGLHPLWGSTRCVLLLTSQIKGTDPDTPLALRADTMSIPY